jgi:endoglucanase
MKSLKIILFVLFGFLMFHTSCTGDKDEVLDSLEVDKKEISIAAQGGSDMFTLKTSVGKWAIENSNPEWLTLSASSGESPQAMISLVVSTLTPEQRNATLTITAGNATPVVVTVTQPGSEYLYTLSASSGTIRMAISGGNSSFKINTTAPQWTIASDSEWLSVDVVSGTEAEKNINVTALANGTDAARSGLITLSAQYAEDFVITVNQTGPLYPNYNTSPIAANNSGMTSTAKQLASKMTVGWNLGNSLEAIGSETAWGNPKTTKAMIDMIKAAGFNTVRIPCSWHQNSSISTAKINDSWLERVKEVVDYCIDNDMYAIINVHWDGGWLENNISPSKQDEVNMKQKAFWEQIATYFRDYDERLLFAGTNEPHAENATQMSVLLSYLQTFVDVVRSTGGRNHYRNLIVQGPVTDIEKTYNLMNKMPTDIVPQRMMLEVHYYTPWPFCGLESDADWANVAYFWGEDFKEAKINGIDRNASTGEAQVIELFSKMKTKFVDKGYPIIMGEYGAINRSNLITDPTLKARHLESRAYYLKYVTQKMKEYGMVPFYWDNGHLKNGGVGDNSFAIFNRNTQTVIDQQALNAIIEGAQASYPF